MSEKGRYDKLQGDEPYIEAARMEKKDQIREGKENHSEDARNENDPIAAPFASVEDLGE